MKSLIALTHAEAAELGAGNHAGFTDYVMLRPRRYDEETDLFSRGYLSGYKLASKGKRPFLMKFQPTAGAGRPSHE